MVRIFSLYWIFALIALFEAVVSYVVGSTGPLATLLETAGRLGVTGVAYVIWANVAIFFQDLDLFLGVGQHGLIWVGDFRESDPPLFEMVLIPQAWSLALELAFYMLAPFVVRRSVGVVGTIALMSLALRLAGAKAGFVHDPWSYRFFPFELLMFLIGALSYALYARIKRQPAQAWQHGFGLSLIAVALLYPVYRTADGTFFSWSKIFLYVYLALALPFLYRATGASRFDRMIGELSYPLYLSHLLFYTALHPLSALASRPDLFTFCIVISSAALSWIVVKFIDTPIDRFRQRLLDARHRLLLGKQSQTAIQAGDAETMSTVAKGS